MSNWEKKHGKKITIRFSQNLAGDVTGIIGATGGWKQGFQDYAAYKPATASNDRSADYSADRAFDEDEGTEWQPGYRINNQTLTVDLEEVKEVKGFTIRRGVGGYYRTGKIEASNDDEGWVQIYQTENYEWGAEYDYHRHEFENVESYRYWRFEGWHRSGNYPAVSILQYNGKAPIGNEAAFSVSGQEPKWVKFPSGELGPLENVNYGVEKVDGYPPVEYFLDDLETGILEDVEFEDGRLILAEQEGVHNG